MLVHVSYSYHAYLESRPKIKNFCWMEPGETFCNIFVTDVHGEKTQVLHPKKLNKKLLIDFDISDMFLYLILVA